MKEKKALTAIPQRLRDIAALLRRPDHNELEASRDELHIASTALYAVAAELEAPAADAVPVVAWLYTESGYGACEPKLYLSKAAGGHACEVFNGTSDPLIRQRDHIATVLALQARIKDLEAENFALAAGQCIVPGGLCGDEGGSQYCSLQQAASNAPPSP